MKKIILYIFLLSGISYRIQAQQERGSIWMHGLDDGPGQWFRYQQQFLNQRQFDRNNTVNPDIDTRQGVAGVANECRGQYTGGGNAIFFGHSMGGVVGRHLDVRPNSGFGGIITVGSPLDGAKIANSIRNGDLVACVQDGQSRVLKGLERNIGYWVPGFEQTANATVNLILTIGGLFFSANQGGQGATDLAEGSDYMNNWTNRNQQTGTNKINIYGNENAPTVWRLASVAIGNGSGGDDEQYVSAARTAGDISEVAMWANIAIGTYEAIITWWCGGCAGWYFFYAADGWRQGMNWWRDDSDSNWQNLIGSGIPASRTVCYQQMNWQGFSDCMNNAGNPSAYMSCQQQNTYDVCYTYNSSVNGLSDAFIKASSQSGYNSEWSNNAVRVEALGVNHLEMKDHPNMVIIYNDTFDGRYGGFFNTARR